MSVSMVVRPLSDCIDMYGEPDISSAYSLSGHVSISLTSSSSLFENRRAVHLLLQSLTITFEGQSELINPVVGYIPLRICSVVRDLAPDEPIELHNDGLEDSRTPCTWNFVFNLPIPGWIPPSCLFGCEDGGTRYSLSATAKFTNVDDGPSGKTWLLSTLCSPLRSRTRTVQAEKVDILVSRFMNPPGIPLSPETPFPINTYLVDAKPEHYGSPQDSSYIPLEVLSGIKVLASIPEYASLDSSSIPFALRLRTEDLDSSVCKRLQIVDFTVELEQLEHYRGKPSSEYARQYPIPRKTEQPPSKPLLNPHPLQTIHELGFLCSPDSSRRSQRSLIMHEPSYYNRYVLSGDTYIFAQDDEDGESDSRPAWYTMETTIPFSHVGYGDGDDFRWAGEGRLRPSGNTPLFNVQHTLHVALTCSYDVPGSSDTAVEKLQFSLPLRFVELTPTSLPSRSPSPASSSTSSTPSSQDMLISEVQHAQLLPAYSQLFDSNGDRKIDYSTPLPMYEPRPSSSSSDLPESKDLVNEFLF